ncbi:MAG: histidinol-phosphate transaminase [Firmicutes bacterium]|nr:histidinol-phosphate transaminase [Bacillota bacterium]
MSSYAFGKAADAALEYSRTPLIRLNANESPYDVPLHIKREIAEAILRLPFNRYPSENADELRRDLSQRLGVTENMVVVGVGSDELLQMIILAWRQRARKVITLYPSFTMYRRIAESVGIPVVEVPFGEGFTLDMKRLQEELSDDASLAFLCNPNNPNGGAYTEEFRTLAREAKGLVVIDEAYYDFCGETLLDEVARPGGEGGALLNEAARPGDEENISSGNIIILRTFSKALRLAGLRMGYGIMAPAVAEQLDLVKLPYNCSSISILAAQMILRHQDELLRVVEEIKKERQRLYAGLLQIGIEVFPSSSNFLLLRPPLPADEAYRRLLDSGVWVRKFARPHDLAPGALDISQYLRVTIGRPEDNDVFLEALSRLR